MITQAMKDQVTARINQDIIKINTKYNVDLKMPSISYDLRGTTAGTANWRTWHIRLNAVLLQENFDDMLNDTVPHELCHLATDLIYPEAHQRGMSVVTASGRRRRAKRSPHGSQWQSIMRAIGVDPTRCHSYDTTNARVKTRTRYDYKCSTCDHVMSVGPKHHAKMQRGAYMYHKSCKGSRLILVNAQPAPELKLAAQQASPTPVVNKRQACLEWFKLNPTVSKAAAIIQFKAFGCTEAGASSYYYSIKNIL